MNHLFCQHLLLTDLWLNISICVQGHTPVLPNKVILFSGECFHPEDSELFAKVGIKNSALQLKNEGTERFK